MIYNLMDRPVVTLTEATMILGLSASTIKRRLESGALKQVEKRVIALSGELEEKSGKIVDLKEQITALRKESLQNGKLLVALQSKYNELSETYDLLASKNSRYMADKAKETKKLLEQLEVRTGKLKVLK